MSQRPSFGWRSILFGRELLSKGLLKKVGNGTSLFVWMDPWIDDGGFRAPYRKNSIFDVALKVSSLLNPRTGFWDDDVLFDLFLPQDIPRIKAIKPVASQNDFFVWQFNKSGDFSVKSAYWLADQEKSLDLRLEANIQPSTLELKKQVWTLQTDPKIKVFLWKVLSGILPVAVNLIGRGVNIDTTCQVCGELGESTNHTLFLCSLSRQVWALSDFPSPSDGFGNGSVFSNIFHLLENKDNKAWPVNLRKSFPWIVWRIWTNRNALLFEGKCFSAVDTVNKIRDDVMEWFEAQRVDIVEPLVSVGAASGDHLEVVQSDRSWKKPPANWFKCNIGASWSRRNNIAGGAWVLRYDKGKALLHSSRSFSSIFSKSDALLRCILWAMESMASHKIDKVIFACQDKSLVGAVLRPSDWPSFKAQAIALNRSLLPFLEWRMEWEVAAANRGANLIAQSITGDSRSQSFVASGHPVWLNRVFLDEEGLSSVCV